MNQMKFFTIGLLLALSISSFSFARGGASSGTSGGDGEVTRCATPLIEEEIEKTLDGRIIRANAVVERSLVDRIVLECQATQKEAAEFIDEYLRNNP